MLFLVFSRVASAIADEYKIVQIDVSPSIAEEYKIVQIEVSQYSPHIEIVV